jgi:hypothetical protein
MYMVAHQYPGKTTGIGLQYVLANAFQKIFSIWVVPENILAIDPP